MFLTTSYPLLDAFWTILIFTGFFLWVWVAIAVIMDIFRSRDLSGWGKALWLLVVFIIPLLGVVLYLIARGGKMHEHSVQAAEAADQASQDYIRSVAGNGGDGYHRADELSRLASLHDSGVLSDGEFEAEKQKVLSGS